MSKKLVTHNEGYYMKIPSFLALPFTFQHYKSVGCSWCFEYKAL